MNLLEKTIKSIGALDEKAMDAVKQRQDALTKPAGSLGRLEAISIQLAGIMREPIPRIGRKVIILGAGDHGVAKEGVSAYPQEVTGQMVLNFLQGGAGINVLARHEGADVIIVDAGVIVDLPDHPALRIAKVRKGGTGNISRGPAMSRKEAQQIVEAGISVAAEQVAAGASLIGTGDMGIANTTPSSAIAAAITNKEPEEVTGRGTGLQDKEWRHKVDIVRRALEVNQPDSTDALDVLARVGGFEIGFLAGVMLGAAANRKAVVLDGFISGAAGLIAHGLCPAARDYLFASHMSVEPGHRAMLAHMGLKPILDLDLRLGEGTGGCLAMNVIEAAALCLSEMATFGEAGVSDKDGK